MENIQTSSDIRNKVVEIVDPVARASFFKKSLLAIFCLTFAFVSFWFLRQSLFLQTSGYFQLEFFIGLSSALFWLLVLAISALVMTWAEFVALFFISAVLVFAAFFNQLGITYLLGAASLSLLLSFLFKFSSESIFENSLKIKPNLFVQANLSKMIFILSLLAALVFWSVRFSFSFDLKDPDLAMLSKQFIFLGVSEKTTVGEMVLKFSEKQILPVFLKSLPPNLPASQQVLVKTTLLKEAEKSVYLQLEKIFGREIKAEETLPSLLASGISSAYYKFPESSRMNLNYYILTAVFLVWFSFLQVLGFLVYPIFWFVFEAFLGLGVIKIGLERVDRETLVI